MSATPHLGQTLIYRLTQDDATEINQRRVEPDRIRVMMKQNPPTWPAGAMAHYGRDVQGGEVFPLIVVELPAPGAVNGKVLLPGSDALYVSNAHEGDGAGQWRAGGG